MVTKLRSIVLVMLEDNIGRSKHTCNFSCFVSTEIADNHGDAGDCHDAVVTVPLHFTEKQRQAVRLCAEKGGFNVLRVVDETSAAALAYDIGQQNHHEDW